VAYHSGDITSFVDVKKFLGQLKPNVVINTASPVAYIDHVHTPDYEKVNMDDNKNLLAACKAVGTVQAYVCTSSGPIFAGAGGAYDPADESYPTLVMLEGAGDPYHLAKAQGDALVLAANDASPGGIRTAIIRPTAMYGEVDQQMVHNLLEVYSRSGQIVWPGDNTALVDSVHVGSMANAHLLAAHGLLARVLDPISQEVDGEAFNITDDAPLQPWNFLRLFWIEMGHTTPLSKVWIIPSWVALLMSEIAEWWTWIFSFGRHRPKLLIKEGIEFLVYMRAYNIGKARERLRYNPKISMRAAVRRAAK
jgi:sterol-4alpha-carboxylate 3-dehydrogenase (decarboxylating)